METVERKNSLNDYLNNGAVSGHVICCCSSENQIILCNVLMHETLELSKGALYFSGDYSLVD